MFLCHCNDCNKISIFLADLVHFHFVKCEISMSVTTDVSGLSLCTLSILEQKKMEYVLNLFFGIAIKGSLNWAHLEKMFLV